MKLSKVILGIVTGVAAGTLMGLLLAPEKGNRTRRRILDKGEDYADALKNKFDEVLDNISGKYEVALKDAEGLFSKGKNKYAEFKKENTTV